MLKSIKKICFARFILFFLCVFVLAFIDQLIKFFVVKDSKCVGGYVLISGILKIRYLKNFGAAFGILDNTRCFLISVTTCVLIVFVWFVVQYKLFNNLYYSIALVSFISGGLGNLIDRIFKGYVVDYCDLIFWPFKNFAVFNFADCLTVFGCFMLFLKILFSKSSNFDFEKFFGRS